jgi:colanic acid/amylovoran biosynthesis glycosyltransferase
MNMGKISVVHLFETYGEAYQPYIPPMLNVLKERLKLDISILTFQKTICSKVHLVPKYYQRRLQERFYYLNNSGLPRLNYVEIFCIKRKINVVHVQQSFLFSKILKLFELPLHQRPKVVITLRGGDVYVKPWNSIKWHDFYDNYGNIVDAFVVMSCHQKNYLSQKWGIDMNRIHVIPISFGHKFEVVPKLFNSNKINIVSAFRMCWEKNIECNLRTVKYLINKGIPVQYHIYGDGPDSGQIYYLIDKYELGSFVIYHGKVDNHVLKDRLVSYDLCLQLSLSESLGMSVIEAQANGLPAIVSNVGGLPEVIIHGETGFCVEPFACSEAADYIELLWKDKALYNRFSEAAIFHSQSNFSIDIEVEKLENLYLELND